MLNGGEVLDVAGEHRQLMLKSSRRDQCIAHLQPMAQRERLHQRDRLLRDGFSDRQYRRAAPLEHLLQRSQLGLVADALKHLKVAHG